MRGDGWFDGRRGSGGVSNIYSFSESLFNLHNLVLMGYGGKSDTGWGKGGWKRTRGSVAMGDENIAIN